MAKVWQQLYNNEFGLLNRVLGPLGLARNWLGDARLVLWSIAALAIWNGLGYYIVLFLAGLQAIPQELYEAAQIDGASPLKQFWYVTLPSLATTVVLTAVLAGINCLQVFTPIDLLTKGGPANASNTIGYFMYRHAFQWFNRGYASAISYVLFMIILVFSITQRMVISKWLGEG